MERIGGPHVVRDVLVLRAGDFGWLCQIRDRQVFIGRLEVEPGTRVPRAGRRGPVTLAADAVRHLAVGPA